MNGLIQPKVVVWFKVYCWFLAVFSLAVILNFLWWAIFDFSETETYEIGKNLTIVLNSLVMALCLAMLTVALLGIFLKPRPWVWVYNLILICLGMMTWLIPVCIPLLLFWIKQQTKLYYGRTD